MLFLKEFTFNPVNENTYVLYNNEKQCIIIDPGCYFPDEQEVLKNFISENGLIPELLLNTHCHLDHVFGNKYISEAFELRLHLHPEEEKMLERAPASGLMFNLPFDNYIGDFIYLNDGDIISLGSDKLEVILTPGHSPGSVCFYCAAQAFIIGGDVLFNNSIGRTDLPGGDHETLLRSIREKLFVLPDHVKVYSGHGNPTTIGDEKRTNPYVGLNNF